MAKNVAARRHAKELRRKAALADRRKLEAAANTLPARVARASQQPIQYCLISETFAAHGMGGLVLARGPSKRDVTWAMFLADTHCMGIKDAFIRELVGPEVDQHLEHVRRSTGMTDIDARDARRLLHDLVAWSAALGFKPPPVYQVAEALFGDVDHTASTTTFEFGRDGKPNYAPAPNESPAVIRRTVAMLTEAVGADGFTQVIPLRVDDWDGEIDDWTDEEDDLGPVIEGVAEPAQDVDDKERLT